MRGRVRWSVSLARQAEHRARPEVRERRLEYSAQWRDANRERRRARDRERYARKKAEREAQ